MLFTHFYLMQEKSLVCISSKQRISWRWIDNFFVNKLTKNMLKKYELLNMILHSCGYKNSCFSELVYNSSVLVLMDVLQLQRCSQRYCFRFSRLFRSLALFCIQFLFWAGGGGGGGVPAEGSHINICASY